MCDDLVLKGAVREVTVVNDSEAGIIRLASEGRGIDLTYEDFAKLVNNVLTGIELPNDSHPIFQLFRRLRTMSVTYLWNESIGEFTRKIKFE